MIQLSYSTINMVYESSHNWVNRMLGFKPEDKAIYHEGKVAHDVIQHHISGVEKHPDLAHLTYHFPMVETKDFDPKMKFSFKLSDVIGMVDPGSKSFYQPKGEYFFIGFADGLNPKTKRAMEIKTSSSPWPLSKFIKSYQRKMYPLGFPWIEEFICVTGQRDMTKWKNEPVKFYSIKSTLQDKIDAVYWLLGGIKIIESGKYDGGLDENGRCTDPFCYYGVNCQFR